MKTTKIRQNGKNGRWIVMLVQQNVVAGEIHEQLLEMKDYKQYARAKNVETKWLTEITRDRDTKFEIGLTLQNQKV